MKRLGKWLWAFLPRRRLRSWRYVSPRRHGVGLLVLLVLVSGTYGYWRLTSNSRVRRQAKAYLVELTGGDWRVDDAHFTLFSGVELKGVELRTPGEALPFFRAERVVLHHRPWTLLTGGRLDVRDVQCEGVVVRVTRDVLTGDMIYPRLRFSPGEGGGSGAFGAQAWWPPLSARQARVLFSDRGGGLDVQGEEWVRDIFGMTRGDGIYQVVLMSDEKGGVSSPQEDFAANMRTGEVRWGATRLDIGLLQHFGVLKDLGIQGGRVAAYGQWDPRTRQGFLDANLADTAMQLPPEWGALRLHSIRGMLRVDANGIFLRGLEGRVAQAGDARLHVVSGWIQGFDPSRPLDPNTSFELRIRVEDLEIPKEPEGDSVVANLAREVNRACLLKGRLAASAVVSRAAGGPVTVSGTIKADGVSVTDPTFPYEIRDVHMEAAFTEGGVEFLRFEGRRGTAVVNVDGGIRFGPAGVTQDVRVEARDVPLDANLHDILRPHEQAIYDSLRPSGLISARVRTHVDEPGGPLKQEITLLMEGKTSLEYAEFPYPLRGVRGEVALLGDRIEIRSAHCSSPGMEANLVGFVRPGARGAAEANLTITGRLPLDRTLARALGKPGSDAFGALRPDGNAQIDGAKIWQAPGGAVLYRVPAKVEGASFTFDRFPYSVTDANGTLLFEPNRVTISHLIGRHKDTPIALRGAVSRGDGNAGARVELQVDAHSVRIDRDLFEALPAAIQRVWRDVDPAGLADVGVRVAWRDLEDPNGLDYACTIRARDVSLRYAGFPYTLRGLRGTVLVRPDRVELRDVTAGEGKMRLALAGDIIVGPGGSRADLSLRADDVPVDGELLSALGGGVFSRLRPGGTCSVDLTRLVLGVDAASGRVEKRPEAASTRASASATAPGAAGEALGEWRLEGRIELKDAKADLGTPVRLTGSVTGRIERMREGLALDANLHLASLSIQQRIMTDVRARMQKDAAGNLLHIDDIVGKAYGGRLAGFAEVRLGEPLEYGFRLVAENMDLSEVFNASVAEANQRLAVEGRLDATLELRASEGNRPARQVSGLLHLSKAKIQKLPVLVNRLEPVFLALPGGPRESYTEGVVEYSLKGDKVLFREIHLRGPGLSLVGSGSMDLRNEAIKIHFLSRPGGLPRLDNLGAELADVLLRELAEIQVTGTLKNPRFRTIPLRGLDDIVKKLTRPEAE